MTERRRGGGSCRVSADLFNFLDEGVVREQRLAALQNLLVTKDAVAVDDEVRALRDRAVENAVTFDRLQIRIAQQREVELQIIGESFLGKRLIGAQAEHFGAGGGEFLIIVPTGRQLADSRGREVRPGKEQDDLFFPRALGELYRAAFRARELEFRRFLANFHAAGIDRGIDRKEQKKNDKRCQIGRAHV